MVPQCVEKLVLFTLNADILQSVRSKILKLFPHILILVRCKILWLDVQKINNFLILVLFAIEMVVLNVFLQKNGLEPLGVKTSNCYSLIINHS